MCEEFSKTFLQISSAWVLSYNQISLVNDFDVAFGHLMNAIAASWLTKLILLDLIRC
jgi:hypothetical protein